MIIKTSVIPQYIKKVEDEHFYLIRLDNTKSVTSAIKQSLRWKRNQRKMLGKTTFWILQYRSCMYYCSEKELLSIKTQYEEAFKAIDESFKDSWVAPAGFNRGVL